MGSDRSQQRNIRSRPSTGVMQMARPRRQGERRRQLVQATSRAIAERGLAGLRLKDIAEEAGLSIGSVLYYYPDIDALLVEVHQQVLEEFYWDRVRATAAAQGALEKLCVAVERGVPDHGQDASLRTIYELHAAAGRTPVHASLLTTLWQRETSLYEQILVDGVAEGVFDLRDTPSAIAETVVALEDAFDLHLVSHNQAVDRDRALRRVLGYLSVVTGVAVVGPAAPS
jgi:AcrR family transcriptional regulator